MVTDNVAVETKSAVDCVDNTEKAVVDAEDDLRCPICDYPLPTMRAVRTHLQSSRHNVSSKTKLTELITLTRERSRDRAYHGGLAKNIPTRMEEEKAATAIDFQILDKTLNMRFGVNSDGQMVITKVSPKSCLYDRRSQLVGARLVSLGGVDVETREKLNGAFRSLGTARPLDLRVLVAEGKGDFLTENAVLRKREEREYMGAVVGDGVGKEVNFYDVLGLQRDATIDMINDAYRKMSLKHHPDKGGDGETFRNINTAFKVLSQPPRRVKYDKQTKKLHPFIEAAQTDDISALRKFDTDAFTSTNSAELIVDRHGSNALHYAAGYGASLEVLDFLIDECKIFVDCTTKKVKHQASSRTPLHWAARNGHLEICKYLIGRGAEPTRGTSDGTSAVHWSLWNEHKETCSYLISPPVGVDINVLNSFKCNAGHFVGLNGNVDCMRFFVENGGDVRRRNNQGHSCIHKAAWRGRMELLKYLFEEGVMEKEEFLRADENGYTPKDIASLGGQDEVIKWLEGIE